MGKWLQEREKTCLSECCFSMLSSNDALVTQLQKPLQAKDVRVGSSCGQKTPSTVGDMIILRVEARLIAVPHLNRASICSRIFKKCAP